MSSTHAAVKSGCLCVVAFMTVVHVAAVPLSVVRAASRCSGAPDAVECLLRAAATGVDALARSAEPVELVPGCVTLVRNAGVQDAADARTDQGVSASAEPVSGETALVDSVTAFARSRAISVRAPDSLLDSLKNTLIEGNASFFFLLRRFNIFRLLYGP